MIRGPGLALAAAVALAGCRAGEPQAVAPDPAYGVQVVRGGEVPEFLERASGFYARLARRRFNTRATYRDEGLREYFQTSGQFSDYYADLAQALTEADFERNRPIRLEVVEFRFVSPGEARVRVRLVGDDSRPLRWGRTVLEREDRWARLEGAWWIVPGKL